MKSKINIPSSHHVQIAELARAKKDKVNLVDSLAKEKEEKEKIAGEMVALQDRMNALQITWDTHTFSPPILPETSSLSEQLTTALATIKALEKQVSTTWQRFIELEAIFAENVKKINAMQREIEEGKQEKARYEKTINDLNSRMKGNVTLLEAK